jgi:hypothetical protein
MLEEVHLVGMGSKGTVVKGCCMGLGRGTAGCCMGLGRGTAGRKIQILILLKKQ